MNNKLHSYFNKVFYKIPLHIYSLNKGKGKAIPLQAWTGPEGSRRLRLPDFKTIGTLMW
jgi:hypothetical protein